MAENIDIASLAIEVSADSQNASVNIDKLSESLNKLKSGSLKEFCSSLESLSNALGTLKTACASIDAVGNLTQKMSEMNDVDYDKAVTGFKALANAVGRLTSAAPALNAVDFSGLSTSMSKLSDALTPIKQIGDESARASAYLINAVAKVPVAAKKLNDVDFDSFKSSVKSLKNSVTPLLGMNYDKLKGLGSALNALSKVPKVSESLKDFDWETFASSCQKAADALTPLASNLNVVAASFAKLPSKLSSVITATNRLTTSNNNAKKSYGGLGNQLEALAKKAASLFSLSSIGHYLGEAATSFNDFYEATDLFHNAMGDLSDDATELIDKMESLLGVDPTNAMSYMATIQSLGTSFGLTSDKAYILSKNLTQLAYDEGSYWNKDVSETFTAMSSAISGEIEPIRRLGIDLSQARLQQELLSLGFTQQVSSLSQADKAVLRYIAIMKQTANIQGNLAQTINSPANQIKVLKSEINQLSKSVGSILYPALKSILPVLIAAVELLKEFVSAIASLFGQKIEFTDFSQTTSSLGGVTDALDDTTDATKAAAKAAKDYTMGFDELNIIEPQTDTSSDSGSGSGSSGNILGDVDLSGYDMFADYVGQQVDSVKEKVRDLVGVVAEVGAGFLAWKIAQSFLDTLDKLQKMNIKLGVSIEWPALFVGSLLSDLDEFRRYFVDFLQNGATFTNVAGMIAGFAGALGDAFALLGNTEIGVALKVVQGCAEIASAIHDISENGVNWDNVTTFARGLTNFAIAIGWFTGNTKLTGTALIIQSLMTIIKEIADNWEEIKQGDFSGVDKLTVLTSLVTGLIGVATVLGWFKNVKITSSTANEVSQVMQGTTQSVQTIDTSMSGNGGLNTKLTSLAKNLAVGLAIIVEVGAAAVLIAGEIWILGEELQAVGDAWQPVLDNGATIAEAIVLGTAILVAVGAATAALGSVPSLAVNIGLGTAMLVEVGTAAALFETQIINVGDGLNLVYDAWSPVLKNGKTISKAIVTGTALLVAVGVATAALGAATVASAGALPVAIGLGTALLVELAVAAEALVDSISDVADEMSGKLYPSLNDLNSKLPSIKTSMHNFTTYLTEFCGEVSSYTKSMGSVTWSSIVSGFTKLFSGNPIKTLANDVGKIYDDTVTLNDKLSTANPELTKAVDLLTEYSSLMSQLKLLTEGANNTELASDIFTNLEECGEKLVTGFISGIDSKLPDLDTEVGKINESLEVIGNADEVKAFKSAGENIIKGLVSGLEGEKKSAYETIVEIGNKLAEKFKNAVGVHSPSTLFAEFGNYIDQGLANGLSEGAKVVGTAAYNLATITITAFKDGFNSGSGEMYSAGEQNGEQFDQGVADGVAAAKSTVDTAWRGLVNIAQNTGNSFVDKGVELGTNFVDELDQTLTSKWNTLDSNLQSDFFGTIKNLYSAAQSGDVETVGTTIAAVIWQAMGDEQRTRIKTVAKNMITDLGSQFKDALGILSDQAYQIGSEIFNGMTSQFGNILTSAKNLGSTLSNTFSALKAPLKSVATAISTALSGGLSSSFPTIFASMGTLISTIGASFVSLLEAIGAALDATVFGIPMGVVVAAAGVALAATIAGIVGSLGGSSSTSTSGSGSTSGTSLTGDTSSVGNIDYSKVAGTSQYNSANASTTSSYASSSIQQLSTSEIKEAVYNGAYNALLDYKQRYANENSNNTFKLYIDGKQITASVEKTQNERGRSIMGTEAYSY